MKTAKLEWINYAGRLESKCGRFSLVPTRLSGIWTLLDRGTVVAQGLKSSLKAHAAKRAKDAIAAAEGGSP